MYEIRFPLPSGGFSTLVASDETLMDLCLGAEHPGNPNNGQLKGVPIKYIGEKAPFESRRQKATPPKSVLEQESLIHLAMGLAGVA